MKPNLEYKSLLVEDKSAPVVFFVHGRAGTREVMWTFNRCLPPDVSIIAPEAPRPDPIGGFSWWDVLSYDDITDEMIDEGVGHLSRFMKDVLSYHELAPRKVLAFGFSQGSGALSLVLQRDLNPLDGLAILAGFVIKDWKENPKTQKPPVFIAHGTEDALVPMTRALDGQKYLESLGSVVTFATDDVGHKVGSGGMKALKSWTEQQLSQ